MIVMALEEMRDRSSGRLKALAPAGSQRARAAGPLGASDGPKAVRLDVTLRLLAPSEVRQGIATRCVARETNNK